MYIVNHRTLFFWITGVILAAALGAIVFFGLPLGIDFTGGSLLEATYTTSEPSLDVLKKSVTDRVALGEISLRQSGETGVTLRTRTLTPAEHEAVLSALTLGGTAEFTEDKFTSVGPALGTELGKKAIWAILAVVLAIVLYIAWAFRKVPPPVPGWTYGLTVVAMLAIDIIVPTGFFAALCHFTGAQVDSLFVVALLALLGYCVNDVIVIFDRVREHLAKNEKTGLKESFETTIGKSIDETMTRSINTGLTVALALLALVFFGAPVTVNFALVMLVGVVAGTFSSICRSAPLLIPLAHRFAKK
ncbi:MAG: protein translocase subunit SecF [bacterium]